ACGNLTEEKKIAAAAASSRGSSGRVALGVVRIQHDSQIGGSHLRSFTLTSPDGESGESSHFCITRSSLPLPHPQGWFPCLRQWAMLDEQPIRPRSYCATVHPVAFGHSGATTAPDMLHSEPDHALCVDSMMLLLG